MRPPSPVHVALAPPLVHAQPAPSPLGTISHGDAHAHQALVPPADRHSSTCTAGARSFRPHPCLEEHAGDSEGWGPMVHVMGWRTAGGSDTSSAFDDDWRSRESCVPHTEEGAPPVPTPPGSPAPGPLVAIPEQDEQHCIPSPELTDVLTPPPAPVPSIGQKVKRNLDDCDHDKPAVKRQMLRHLPSPDTESEDDRDQDDDGASDHIAIWTQSRWCLKCISSL
ncbi:hypothetical protein JB92DRAFT_2824441 [Gautieria morchelliformis]|nr:hypothetical protein JB92DRAFT_2824441 [Gautieria morchelliformis]